MFQRFERMMNEEGSGGILDGGGAPPVEEAPPVEDESKMSKSATGEGDDLPAWLNDIDEEYRGEKSLHSFKDLKDVAKSYVHLSKLMGKDNKVALPDNNSSQEEINDFYSKLGRPESADEYEIKEGEDAVFNEDFVNNFKQLAHKNNLLPKQAEALFSQLREQKIEEDKVLSQEAEQAIADGLQELHTKWGEEGFKANANRANHVIKEFGQEGLTQYLVDAGLDNDPMLIEFLANIGTGMNEDTFKDSVKENFGITKDEAQAELNKIMNDMDGPYYHPENLDHKRVDARVTKLHEILAS